MPAPQNPTRIFVSHISEEAEIAALLQEAVERDFLGLVKLFASSDIGSIVAGDDWLAAVQQAMDQATAVIVLCSHHSVHRPWVQFELGAAWSKQLSIIPVCHSGMSAGELPMPLSRREAVELCDPEGIARLYQAVATLLKLGRVPEPGDVSALQQRVAQLEQRFQQTGVQQFENFIEIVLPPPGRLEGPAIPMDAKVESNDSTMELFGLMAAGGRTWADIVKAAGKKADKRWLTQLQHCVHKASQNEVFRPVQAIYHAEGASYQPQLAKKETLIDGTTRFHVHFVETVAAPLMEIQNELGLLATLLRLGLRFRYEVLERYRKLTRAAALETSDAQAAQAYVLGKLRGAIEIIENDALSRGAQNIDAEAVAALFEQHADQDEMAEIQKTWLVNRVALFKSDPAPAELDSIVATMRDMNFRFMRLATRRYHEMICVRLAPKPVRVSSARPSESALLPS